MAASGEQTMDVHGHAARPKRIRKPRNFFVACDQCKFIATSAVDLARHKLYRHSDEKPFPCRICPMACKTRFDLLQHLLTHKPGLLHRCAQCAFSARTMTTIRKHCREQHRAEQQQFHCHLCDKVASRGNNLTRHYKIMHKDDFPLPAQFRAKYVPTDDGHFQIDLSLVPTAEQEDELILPN